MRSIRSLYVILLAVVLATSFGWPAYAADTKSRTERRGTADDSRAATVDINTATAEELDALPGVGKATAKKIVDNRPYSSKRDLLDKKIISQGTYDKIKDRIVAHRSESEDSKVAPRSRSGRDGASADARPNTTGRKDSGQTVAARQAPHRGDVWVNTATGVFHREGDVWYGKTKQGKYMSENDALRAGYRESKQGASKEGASAKQ